MRDVAGFFVGLRAWEHRPKAELPVPTKLRRELLDWLDACSAHRAGRN